MRVVDLSKILKPYKSGWVAIDKNNNKVVAHAEEFETITDKIDKLAKKNKDILLVPASENYFGFITNLSNG